ncbi:MAG: hypothetical protein AVDCRST_MAG89-2846 [uncultured Gemmatimonadetes bacterium]|uniref:Blue (type 1) copper domain-containing protein n=1 Tax=uncultured Gemmatimonadota bacterium TaxID=203437 RepID=A0A6J4M089_9BACT|nr:MAG: hypothetical protein AVDCRST_MAG89-2846 [uncultured Gemmatimonadota bacterium]
MTRNIRTIGSLALVLALGAASACGGGSGGGGGGPPTGTQTGTVAGRVSNGAAGVAGVSVSIAGGGSATTDAGGNFSIGNVTTGARTVAITMPAGFITANPADGTSKEVTVSAGQSATANFGLKRGVVVTASGTSFSPKSVSVPTGATVRWVNAGGGAHTVTPATAGQAGGWASANLPEGALFEHTFGTAGNFNYRCLPHEAMGMTGSVGVGGSTTTPPEPDVPSYDR